MAQNFSPMQETDTLTASRLTINNNFVAVQSNFSGTAFPTLNLVAGMQCYRTDEGKMYTLKSTGPSVWIVVQRLNEVFVTQTDSDARYFRLAASSRADLALRGKASGAGDTAAILFHSDDNTLRYRIERTSAHDLVFTRYNAEGTYVDSPFSIIGGQIRVGSNKIWHQGNDGSGSGLDADVLRSVAPSTFGLTLLAAANADAVVTALGLQNTGGQPGDIKHRYGQDAQTGWLLMNGLSIGSATSGATGRANADCEALFTHLWYVDPILAMSGGRGASAAADWAANKRMSLPDARGRALFGTDTLGFGPEASAGRIWWATIASGQTNFIGAYGGSSLVYLTISQMPAHSHSGYTDTQGYHSHNFSYNGPQQQYGSGAIYGYYTGMTSYFGSTDGTGSHAHNVYTYNAGGGEAHAIMPPFMLVGVYIKL